MVQDSLSKEKIAPNVDGEVKCGEVDRDNECSANSPTTTTQEAVCLFSNESSATSGLVDV
jgi:hypothetical protein